MEIRRNPDAPTALVAVINCGVGNLNSVRNALAKLGADSLEASAPEDLARAQAVILPGVGAFPPAMRNLRAMGLDKALEREVLEKRKPFLGICLGMQLLADSSEEFGLTPGLAWISGRVERMPENGVRLPHVGWNVVTGRDPLMFARIPEQAHFYFDHSYHLACDNGDCAAMGDYGAPFVAAVRKGNIWATQFHPEKSQLYGLMLLRNFLNTVKAEKACSNHG